MKIAAFGDSFLALSPNCVEFLTQGMLGHTLKSNQAVGGSVSGGGEHYVYKVNGEVLPAKGLLGQLEDYHGWADVHVIWSGNNDLVCAAMLDPFTTDSGDEVECTELVTGFREGYLQNHTKLDYAQWIVKNYLVANIRTAITSLIGRGHEKIIVIGYLNLAEAPIAHELDQMLRATMASGFANEQLKALCEEHNVVFVDPYSLEYSTIDEIHPDPDTHFSVLMEMLEAVY